MTAVWIERAAPAAGEPRPGPLHGRTFAVKDNIDVAGYATTAALPGRAGEVAKESAPVVDRLECAGAVFLGKTNLDQAATGLVGTRSPYGTPLNPLDPSLIPGGSSSGSAVAVALGEADLGLATDTAGSGRVPAACCGIVGLKPAPGVLSNAGVVPASPSFDCVSLFTRRVDEALLASDVLGAGFPRRPTSRRLVVGVPSADGSRPFLTAAGNQALDTDAAALAAEGHDVVDVDLSAVFAAGDLLYEGAWLAERTASVSPLLVGDGVNDVVRTIVERGRAFTGVEVFDAIRRLDELRRTIAVELWTEVDVLLVPSVPHVPTLDDVASDPIAVNARLGRYTTFANLLGLAAITVPRGLRTDGSPASATVLGPRGSESGIARAAVDLERAPSL